MNKDITHNEDIVKIKKTIEKFRLPTWDELPSIYLYMDQVIELTTEYFEGISSLIGDEKILTAPMINNYIKLKVMPAPVKKRYGKAHLAYLFMISSLKQCMNISAMESIIPLMDDEEKIKAMYSDFTANQKAALDFLKNAMDRVLENRTEQDNQNLMLQVILASNFMKIFASGVTNSFALKNDNISSEEKDAVKELKKDEKEKADVKEGDANEI